MKHPSPNLKFSLSGLSNLVNVGNIVLSVLPIFFVLLVLLTMPSCSSRDPYDFKDTADAISCYRAYLSDVKSIQVSNTNDFTKELRKWKEVNDTVYHFLVKDSAFTKPHNKASEYYTIHDSVRTEMLRITETWRYSYEDVLKIKEQSSPFQNDKDLQNAVEEAEPFFVSLNDIEVSSDDKQTVLVKYRQLLSAVRSDGFQNKNDMLNFIKQEDIIFRSFLSHLYEMDNEPLADITRDTELICQSIFIAAREGKISARDVMVYMSMRTVRRLLQNSVVCMTNINKQGMKNQAQGNAYVWMIIQPFISIDQFAIATLTPQERSNFNYIVSQLPKSTRFAKTFDIEQRSLNYLLPQQLLKIYILSL